MPILTAIRSGTENAVPQVAARNDSFCFPVIFTALPWLAPASDPTLGLPKYTKATAMTVRYPSGFT